LVISEMNIDGHTVDYLAGRSTPGGEMGALDVIQRTKRPSAPRRARARTGAGDERLHRWPLLDPLGSSAHHALASQLGKEEPRMGLPPFREAIRSTLVWPSASWHVRRGARTL